MRGDRGGGRPWRNDSGEAAADSQLARLLAVVGSPPLRESNLSAVCLAPFGSPHFMPDRGCRSLRKINDIPGAGFQQNKAGVSGGDS
ncbi:MAG: hypothetical protein E6X17_00005 [Sporomusaceae bacterium]|nr:hypothetical protein [Sporomusaceae bacterium]